MHHIITTRIEDSKMCSKLQRDGVFSQKTRTRETVKRIPKKITGSSGNHAR